METLLLLTLMLGLSSPAAWADAGKISGEISLGKGVKLPKGATFFISARPVAGGPPLAVAKLDAKTLPAKFTLGQANSMMGAQLEGEVELTARASQSGEPMARTPGDLVGKLKVKVGAKDAKVVLDQAL